MTHHAIPCPDRDRLKPPPATSVSTRMLLVTVLTLVTMVAEIAAGWLTGSVALLADGIHMGTHAAAIGAAWLAHTFARRYASDARFSFGTGKVEALAAFGSTVLLALAALGMVVEAAQRLISPQPIQTSQALIVAGIGLTVNLVCAWLLSRPSEEKSHGHHHGNHHDGHHHGPRHSHGHAHRHDLNVRAAYLHVITDAMTSILAIVALVAAATIGLLWLDPVVAVIGAAVILHWSYGLARESGAMLLDREAGQDTRRAVERALEADGMSRITDLHIWQVGSGRYSLVASVSAGGTVTPAELKKRLPRDIAIVHPVIEVN